MHSAKKEVSPVPGIIKESQPRPPRFAKPRGEHMAIAGIRPSASFRDDDTLPAASRSLDDDARLLSGKPWWCGYVKRHRRGRDVVRACTGLVLNPSSFKLRAICRGPNV